MALFTRAQKLRPILAGLLVVCLVSFGWAQQFPQLDTVITEAVPVDCFPSAGIYVLTTSLVVDAMSLGGINRAAYFIEWNSNQNATRVTSTSSSGFSDFSALGNFGASGTVNARLWRLLQPNLGSNQLQISGLTFQVTSPQRTRYFFAVYSFFGVSQVAPDSGQQNSAPGAGTQFSESTTIGGFATDLNFDSVVWSGNPTFSEPTVAQSGQTIRGGFPTTIPCSGFAASGATSTIPGTSHILAYNNPSNQSWNAGNITLQGGVSQFSPAAAGVSGPFRPLVGVGI